MFTLLVNGYVAHRSKDKEQSQMAFSSILDEHVKENYFCEGRYGSNWVLIYREALKHGSITTKLSNNKNPDVNLTLLYIA